MATQTLAPSLSQEAAKAIEDLLELAEIHMRPGWASHDHRVIAGKRVLDKLRAAGS